MRTGVYPNFISCVLATAILAAALGMSLVSRSPHAQAATLVKQHYLIIEKEDTVSEALDRHFPCRTWRLWGKKGAVARVAALNPHIQDINHLHPGMVIDIGPYADTAPCDQRAPASVEQPEFAQQSEPAPEPEISQMPVPIKAPEPAPDPAPLPQLQPQPQPVQKPEPQVTPQAAPSAAIQQPIVSDRYGLLDVRPEFSFARIESIDKATHGNAIFASSLIPGLRFSWAQHWSKHIQTSLSLGVRSETYAAPAGFKLENASHTMADFGMGLRWVPFENASNFALDSALEFHQEIFARSVSLTTVSLDAIMIPELSLGIRYRVLELSPFSLTLHAHGLILFPQRTTSYSIESGTASEVGILFSEEISRKLQLSGGLQYSTRSQDTTIATQTRTDLGITFGVTFRLDADVKQKTIKSGDMP